MPLCDARGDVGAWKRSAPTAQRFLLIPENHTRNTFYLQNVAALAHILRQTGLHRAHRHPDSRDHRSPPRWNCRTAARLTLEPLLRKGDRIGLDGFDPCAVLLNNDLFGGRARHSERHRADHHAAAARGLGDAPQVAATSAPTSMSPSEFARLVGIDPWLINPYFTTCGKINFQERQGEDCLAAKVDDMLQKIRVKYGEYGMTSSPSSSSRPTPAPTAWAS